MPAASVCHLVALQGFASGDLERDATAVRMFTDAGVELLLSQVCIFTPLALITTLADWQCVCNSVSGSFCEMQDDFTLQPMSAHIVDCTLLGNHFLTVS